MDRKPATINFVSVTGCRGNANNFATLEDCVNTCGGLNDPGDSLICSETQCDNDQNLANFYRSKVCKPVVKPGECCPSSWDCAVWEERMRRTDQCFAVSDEYPNGKFYDVGDEMTEINKGCYVNCR